MILALRSTYDDSVEIVIFLVIIENEISDVVFLRLQHFWVDEILHIKPIKREIDDS